MTLASIDRVDGSGLVYASDANGAYDPKTGTIYLALDAEQGAYLFFAVHELTHKIKAENPAGYAILRDFVLDALENNPSYRDSGITLEQRIQQKQAEYADGLTDEEALEEVICNTIPVILSDEQVLKNLVRTDRTLAGQIRDFFEDFYNTIFNQLDRVIHDGNRMEAAALAGDLDTIRTIADLFNAALGGATISEGKASEDIRYASKKYRIPRKLADLTEKEYNTYGWTWANYALSKQELSFFFDVLGSVGGSKPFKIDGRDCYAVPIGTYQRSNTALVITDGKYENPSIFAVIRSKKLDDSDIVEQWKTFYDVIRLRGYEASREIIRKFSESDDSLHFFDVKDEPTFRGFRDYLAAGVYGGEDQLDSGIGNDGRRNGQSIGSAFLRDSLKQQAPTKGAYLVDSMLNPEMKLSVKGGASEESTLDVERALANEAELERVKAENERLAGLVSSLKEQMVLTKGYRPNEKALARVARNVLKQTASKNSVDPVN